MEAYLRTFHEEYIGTVEKFVPAQARAQLIRYSLLPAPVTGYVSTQLGAGYEYGLGDERISTRRSSRRIEELFVDGPPWLARVGPMFLIGGRNIGFARLTLEGGFPFRFTDEAADVYFHEVRFKTGTWSRDVQYAQLFGDRREESWSEPEAVRRAKDEVLAAMLDLQQSAARRVDLGTYLQTFKERLVLVLGDFNKGRDRLEAIRVALGRAGYHAVLLDEIPEEPNYDLPQKFQAVAAVCRFLVFEDSTPAGHIGEMFLAETLHSVRILLREGEQTSTFMTRGMGLTSKVVREWSYDPENLEAVIDEAVSWAEEVVTELAERRDVIYPWRSETAGAEVPEAGGARPPHRRRGTPMGASRCEGNRGRKPRLTPFPRNHAHRRSLLAHGVRQLRRGARGHVEARSSLLRLGLPHGRLRAPPARSPCRDPNSFLACAMALALANYDPTNQYSGIQTLGMAATCWLTWCRGGRRTQARLDALSQERPPSPS
jgi:hypothetical protein